jgi:hypothetical protein
MRGIALPTGSNGWQLWTVNVFSYTIHAKTDSSPSCSPLALSIFFSFSLWRFQQRSYFVSNIVSVY